MRIVSIILTAGTSKNVEWGNAMVINLLTHGLTIDNVSRYILAIYIGWYDPLNEYGDIVTKLGNYSRSAYFERKLI